MVASRRTPSKPAPAQNGKETSGAGLVAQLSDATFLKAKARRAFLGLVLILFVRSVISGVLNQPSSADRDLTRPVFFVDGEFDASQAGRSLAGFGIGAVSLAAGRAIFGA